MIVLGMLFLMPGFFLPVEDMPPAVGWIPYIIATSTLGLTSSDFSRILPASGQGQKMKQTTAREPKERKEGCTSRSLSVVASFSPLLVLLVFRLLPSLVLCILSLFFFHLTLAVLVAFVFLLSVGYTNIYTRFISFCFLWLCFRSFHFFAGYLFLTFGLLSPILH